MKKSLIALSLVSIFSAGSVLATENSAIIPNPDNRSNESETIKKYIYEHGELNGNKITFAPGNKLAGYEIDIKSGSVSDQTGKLIGKITYNKGKAAFNGTDKIDNNNGSDFIPPINHNKVIDGSSEVIDTFDAAVEVANRVTNNETVVELRDSQGNTIGTIDAHNVHKYQKDFMELSDQEKINVLKDIQNAVSKGQIVEGHTPSPRPEPTDPTVDDAMDWVNERINGAGREVAIAAAQYDARLDSLEANFNAMAERQLQQERRINTNEGKMSNGIAGVAAMANIPTVSGKTTFGAGVGHFNGSNAIAIGASTGFENGISLKGSLSYAKGKWDQKDVVVGAGIGYSF
ncbi:exported hypothetical protein [Vibrio nigripulchritudo MADA3029]|uniref:YadA C-terminal domain-containing protein n=1 Tax=Vibrio nigripulchritudo TaxID=28173 RepID=UPI0003B180B8|nr:YadA C-terminal domain-containing protein [Vibrio nigripulchritudo]CCN46114.1 exported hypothetical protein [Vibrio nigripulchritudo MADA3020]CCN51730.1 exported hypothetical protein [Vibrio nigripulchritudo MADA3021]CCN61894.1 exported hypothetical protein [Vibrio nigripulchritudo MADA3029]